MGKHGKVQTALEYGAARSILTGLQLLPRPVALAAGRGLARIAYMFGGRLRRTGERTLELALPGLGADGRAAILRNCFANLGRLLGEFSHLPRATPESLRRI